MEVDAESGQEEDGGEALAFPPVRLARGVPMHGHALRQLRVIVDEQYERRPDEQQNRRFQPLLAVGAAGPGREVSTPGYKVNSRSGTAKVFEKLDTFDRDQTGQASVFSKFLKESAA